MKRGPSKGASKKDGSISPPVSPISIPDAALNTAQQTNTAMSGTLNDVKKRSFSTITKLPSINFLTTNCTAPTYFSFSALPNNISAPEKLPSDDSSLPPDELSLTFQHRKIDSYYQIIHPTLPILPSSKIKLKQFLVAFSDEKFQNLSEALLDVIDLKSGNTLALLEAMNVVIQSFQGSLDAMTLDEKVLYLTSLIFLFLSTNEIMWLSNAVSIAYSMGLHNPALPSDHRRLFWVLFVLDTLNATVKNMPFFIHAAVDPAASAESGGGVNLDLLKLCIVLRHNDNTGANASHLLTELHAVRAGLEATWDTTPVLKALYHFAVVSIATARKVVIPSLTELSSLLVSPLLSVSPLMPYFYQMLVDTSCQLLTAPATTATSPGDNSVIVSLLLDLKSNLGQSAAGMSKKIEICLIHSGNLSHHRLLASPTHHHSPPTTSIDVAKMPPSPPPQQYTNTGLEKLATAAEKVKLFI
jgi:hypothetical protein